MTEDAPGPISDARAIAEALADVLAERGLVVDVARDAATRVLCVSDVAKLLGRRAAWVYAHAEELGAFRFGTGPRARLGFDVAEIERWKRAHQVRSDRPVPAPRRRRSRQEGLPRGAKLIPYEPLHEQA